PTCTRIRARCASPTGPTKCTATRSPSSSSRSTSQRRSAEPRVTRATPSSLPVRQRRYGPRLAVRAGRNVGERRFGDFDGFDLGRIALRVHLDVDGDGSGADAHDVAVEGKHVADGYGLLELELVDRDGDHAAERASRGEHAPGDVDLRHDPAAENVAVLVGVGRHGHDAKNRVLVLRQVRYRAMLP